MKRKKWNKKRGFTLVEVLVVLAIIGVLFILILPALASTRERAQIVNCINNMKQLTIAAFMYADDYDDERIPDVPETSSYIDDDNVYICPRDFTLESDDRTTSYRACGLTPETLLPSAVSGHFSENILYIETNNTADRRDIELIDEYGEIVLDNIALRHDNGTVVAFLDGHIMNFTDEQLAALFGLFQKAAAAGEKEIPAE